MSKVAFFVLTDFEESLAAKKRQGQAGSCAHKVFDKVFDKVSASLVGKKSLPESVPLHSLDPHNDWLDPRFTELNGIDISEALQSMAAIVNFGESDKSLIVQAFLLLLATKKKRFFKGLETNHKTSQRLHALEISGLESSDLIFVEKNRVKIGECSTHSTFYLSDPCEVFQSIIKEALESDTATPYSLATALNSRNVRLLIRGNKRRCGNPRMCVVCARAEGNRLKRRYMGVCAAIVDLGQRKNLALYSGVATVPNAPPGELRTYLKLIKHSLKQTVKMMSCFKGHIDTLEAPPSGSGDTFNVHTNFFIAVDTVSHHRTAKGNPFDYDEFRAIYTSRFKKLYRKKYGVDFIFKDAPVVAAPCDGEEDRGLESDGVLQVWFKSPRDMYRSALKKLYALQDSGEFNGKIGALTTRQLLHYELSETFKYVAKPFGDKRKEVGLLGLSNPMLLEWMNAFKGFRRTNSSGVFSQPQRFIWNELYGERQRNEACKLHELPAETALLLWPKNGRGSKAGCIEKDTCTLLTPYVLDLPKLVDSKAIPVAAIDFDRLEGISVLKFAGTDYYVHSETRRERRKRIKTKDGRDLWVLMGVPAPKGAGLSLTLINNSKNSEGAKEAISQRELLAMRAELQKTGPPRYKDDYLRWREDKRRRERGR